MRQSRFSYALALAVTLVLAVPRFILQATERIAAFVVSLWPSNPDHFDFGFGHADRQVLFAGDCPVDSFTSNSLRHEAGMRRLN